MTYKTDMHTEQNPHRPKINPQLNPSDMQNGQTLKRNDLLHFSSSKGFPTFMMLCESH